MSPVLIELIKTVGQLSSREIWLLVNHMMNQLQHESDQEAPTRLTWMDAAGMSPNLMRGVDAQAFINDLRNEWDEREKGLKSAL